jgi:putative redox protein
MVENVQVEFKNSFKGVMKAPHGEVAIGVEEGELRPYNLLFGALASCFYSTFLDIIEKKRLTFDGATIEVSGTKRTEVPTTLDYVMIKFTIKNASDEAKFVKSAELAGKYCSIYQTISKVADIELMIEFIK